MKKYVLIFALSFLFPYLTSEASAQEQACKCQNDQQQMQGPCAYFWPCSSNCDCPQGTSCVPRNSDWNAGVCVDSYTHKRVAPRK